MTIQLSVQATVKGRQGSTQAAYWFRNLRTVLVLILVFALATSAVYAKPSESLGREACTLAEVASCSNNLYPSRQTMTSVTFVGFSAKFWGALFGGTNVGTQIGTSIGESSNDDSEDGA